MGRHGKRYEALRAGVDRNTMHSPAEAVALVKKGANAKFDETIEVHLNTTVDPRHADQQVRGVVTLPNGQAGKCASSSLLALMGRPMRPKPVLIMWAATTWPTRFRAGGWILMLCWRHRI